MINNINPNIKAIEVKNLTVCDNNSKLIEDVNFSIPSGSLCAFIGHNGAGKTTTVKALLGLNNVTNGDIKINGVSFKDVESRRNIGYIPEKENLEKIKTNVFLNGMGLCFGLNKNQINAKIAELSNIFYLPKHCLTTKLNQLSSGQNKLVNIIQAFLGNPTIIIADEPTNALDPESRDIFWDFVHKYHEQNPRVTFLIITHNLDEIEKYADYLLFMNHGKLTKEMSYDKSPGLRKKYQIMREGWEKEWKLGTFKKQLIK